MYFAQSVKTPITLMGRLRHGYSHALRTAYGQANNVLKFHVQKNFCKENGPILSVYMDRTGPQ
jgi:hypothetical protein